ncbi:MAG: thiamine pyrophosphate-binding protein [Opitutus sp.]|nr:thiamine pyrophosphate-binding protein [Opitutus sp.]
MNARMDLRQAVAAVRAARGDSDVVISSMGTAREWLAMGPLHPLDFVYIPSAMGHAAALGLGLALAQPRRRVIVMIGDGSLLMSLGSLATIAAARPENLVTLVFDNGVYEITGAQPTPATAGAERSRVDFGAVARACGIGSVHAFREIGAWTAGVAGVLAACGPTIAVLEVAPVPGAAGPKSPGPTSGRGPAFMAALRER